MNHHHGRVQYLVACGMALLLASQSAAQQDPDQPASVADLIQQAYQLSRQTTSEEGYSEIIALCRQAAEAGATAEQAKYVRDLTSWAQNRRGELLVELAGAAAEQGDQAAAEALDRRAQADFEAAIKNDPQRWKAYHNRGVSRGVAGELELAEQDFSRVIQLNPQYANAWFNRGEIRFEMARFDAALQDYNQALQLDGNDAGFYTSRGHVLFQLMRFQEALDDYQQAVQLQPDDAEHYANRGDTYRSLGQWEPAAVDYRRALELDPQLARAYQSAAWLMSTCPDQRYRDAELAVEAAEKAVQLNGREDFVYLDTLAAAYANAGQFQQATQTIQEALEVAPPAAAPRLQARAELYGNQRPYRQQLRNVTNEPRSVRRR